MDEATLRTLGAGAIVIVVGVCGWVLPYRWNVLRLRRSVAGLFSEETNRKIPRVFGTVLILAGLALLIAMLFGLRM